MGSIFPLRLLDAVAVREPTDRLHQRVTRLAEVVPFRGVRYNPDLIPELSEVVSPPYDIISPTGQKLYHNRHPHNAIRLDFGMDMPDDNDVENRYTRASTALDEWLQQGILQPDETPALYLLREEFTGPDGQPAVRDGFIAAVKLAEFSEGVVLPHEETAPGPKQDRLDLMETTEANLSPIFCLYSDPDHRIEAALTAAAARQPDERLSDDAGTRHSLWVVDDEHASSLVSGALAGRQLLIADGHHRYETALAYRDARRAQELPVDADGGAGELRAGIRPYDYLMVYLSSMEGPSQSILPIHRLISGLSPETVAGMLQLLEQDFEIEEIAGSGRERSEAMIERMTAASRDRNAFGLYLPGQDSYRVLVARRPRPMLDAAEIDHSGAWRSLDVAVLDRLVLKKLLGIAPAEANAKARVTFVERTGSALDQAHEHDAVFFVNATSMAEIKAVAEAGEKMPQKSTYFYPKPLTGLVFRCFRFG